MGGLKSIGFNKTSRTVTRHTMVPGIYLHPWVGVDQKSTWDQLTPRQTVSGRAEALIG
jgi:hypothetical protein